MKTKTTHDRMMHSILITGIVIACFYWVCESFMFFFLAPEANFFQYLLGPNLFQTFTRVLVLCIFAIFGSHIQYTLNKERESDEALRVSEEKYRNYPREHRGGVFRNRPAGQPDLLQRPPGAASWATALPSSRARTPEISRPRRPRPQQRPRSKRW